MGIQFLLISTSHFSLIALLVLLLSHQPLSAKLRFLIFIFIIILVDNFCIYAIPKLIVIDSVFNWIGKFSELLLGISLVFILKPNKQDFGLINQYEKGSIRSLTIAFICVAVFMNGLMYLSDGFKGANLEAILFQATMPGITEELLYRGILLGLFNNFFHKRRTFFGVEMGLGVLITSLLFGLAHGLVFDRALNFHFDIVTLVFTSLLGFLFAYSKERSGSIIPGVLGHNLINTMGSF